MKQHWLVRPGTIRILWIVFLCILALMLTANLFTEVHGWFGLDGTFAFSAWYGFAACIVMIVIAKLIGRLLRRKDSYYDRD